MDGHTTGEMISYPVGSTWDGVNVIVCVCVYEWYSCVGSIALHYFSNIEQFKYDGTHTYMSSRFLS